LHGGIGGGVVGGTGQPCAAFHWPTAASIAALLSTSPTGGNPGEYCSIVSAQGISAGHCGHDPPCSANEREPMSKPDSLHVR
jgi:hypothetical protein